MMGAFTATGFGLAISAALIYILLRFLVAEPHASNAAAAISRHAFWTALIAFLASGTSGLANLWANPPGPGTELATGTGPATMVMHAAAPGLWLGIVYVLGQFTWPRHLKPVRAASLEVRRLGPLIPKFLAGFLLLCTMISTVLIIVAWNDAGSPSRQGTDQSSGIELPIYDGGTDEYGNPVDEDGNMLDLGNPEDYITRAEAEAAAGEPPVWPITGTRQGNVVGPYLLGGLGLVLLGALGAASVVVHRPPLDSLGAEDNTVLRAIWINRLLRTTIFVVAGFGSAALAYLSEGIRARAQWDLPPGRLVVDAHAEGWANGLSGGTALWMLLVIVVILAFGPPKLSDPASFSSGTVRAPSASFSTARDFLLLAQFAAMVAVALIVFLAGLQSESSDPASWRFGEAAWRDGLGSLALVLLLAAAGYLLLNLGAAWVVSLRLGGQRNPGAQHPRLLPVWFLVLVLLAFAAGLACIVTFSLAAPAALRPAAWWGGGILAVTGLLSVALYRSASHRPPLKGASASEDSRIRILVAHRGLRVFGGVSLLVAALWGNVGNWFATTDATSDYIAAGGQPSGFQLACLLLGVVLCLLPASTARPAATDSTAEMSRSEP